MLCLGSLPQFNATFIWTPINSVDLPKRDITSHYRTLLDSIRSLHLYWLWNTRKHINEHNNNVCNGITKINLYGKKLIIFHSLPINSCSIQFVLRSYKYVIRCMESGITKINKSFYSIISSPKFPSSICLMRKYNVCCQWISNIFV